MPKGTVSNWLLGTHNPANRLHRFFQAVPSPELSYVIGVVYGDGYVTEDKGNGIVGFTNKDKSLLEHFLLCLSTIFNTEKAGRITKGTRYGVSKATIGSRLLALFLQKPLVEIAPFIEEYPASFLRGFFDAEGHATVTIGRERLRASVGASNTDIEVLQYISGLLRDKFGISSRITVGREPLPTAIRGRSVNFTKPVHRLSICRFCDLETFVTRIGFESRRKQTILENAVLFLRGHGSRTAVFFWHRSYAKIGSRWCKRTAPLPL